MPMATTGLTAVLKSCPCLNCTSYFPNSHIIIVILTDCHFFRNSIILDTSLFKGKGEKDYVTNSADCCESTPETSLHFMSKNQL